MNPTPAYDPPDTRSSRDATGRHAGGNLFRDTLAGFVDDECPRHAAALAFYAVFCLPALVLLATLIASVFVDAADVRGSIAGRLGSLIGPGGASEVATILEQADADGSRSGIAAVLGNLALLFGASAAFALVLFAAILKWIPDAEIAWRAVGLGAAVTWARHVGLTIAPSRGAVWSGAAPDKDREPGG